jgi:hypothetical protein
METDPPLAKRKNEIQKTHTHAIKFVQINLYHSKAATVTSCQQLAEGKQI